MAAIIATPLTGAVPYAVSETTLGASDTLTYKPGALLVLRNPTAGALSPVIDGADASTVNARGIGTIDISGGFAVGSIAAGDAVAIRLDKISEYLVGIITITGGTGLVAALLEA